MSAPSSATQATMLASPPTVPTVLDVRVEGIPNELIRRNQWVAWAWEPRKDKPQEWTKVPINLYTGGKADTTNLATCGDITTASKTARHRKLPGIGYVFSRDDPYFGIDVDDAFDPATGQLTPAAVALLERFGTYAERSVTGRGLHIIGRTTTTPHEKSGNKRGPLECYWHSRFFAFTGRRIRGYATITDCGDMLAAWHAETFGPKATPAPRTKGAAPLGLDDEAVLQRARRSPAFCRLFDGGDMSAYGNDWSDADLGALNHLVRAGADNASQLDRLHRRGALMRGKWDEQRGATTYGERTIAKALDGTVSPQERPPTITVNGRRAEATGHARGVAAADPCGDIRDDVAELRAEVAQLRAENADLRTRLNATDRRAATAETELARLSTFHSAAMAALGNAALNPAERIVAVMTLKEIAADDRGDPDGTQHYIPVARVAQRAGVSLSTAASAVETIKAGLVVTDPAGGEAVPVAVITKTVRWAKDVPDPKTGIKRDVKQSFLGRVNADLAGDLRTIARAERIATRNHGGKRTPCPKCGCTDRKTICVSCGHTFHSTATTQPAPADGVTEQDADLLVSDAGRPADADENTTPSVAPSSKTVKLATYHNGHRRPYSAADARADLMARKAAEPPPEPPWVAASLHIPLDDLGLDHYTDPSLGRAP